MRKTVAGILLQPTRAQIRSKNGAKIHLTTVSPQLCRKSKTGFARNMRTFYLTPLDYTVH